MIINCRAFCVSHSPAGSFVDPDTGKTLTYPVRSLLKVFLPNDRFPSDVMVRGEYPIGEGTVDIDLSIRKEKISAKVVNYVPKQ